MVEYYKTSGGYFYKINKKGEVTRVSSEVYKKNVMKGGAGGGGGGDGSDSNVIIDTMNKLPWNEYPIILGGGTHRNGINAAVLYQTYRNTKLPNIMKETIDDIAVAYFQFPIFYGSSASKNRYEEWVSHRKIMDLVLIRFLINKYKENATIITKCYNNHYLYDFINFYTNIFNAIDPNFIRQFNQKKLLEIRSEQREHLKSLLDENMIEIFQKKLQDLELYETIMSELHPNSTTKIQQLEMLISKYRQILEILQE